MPRTEQTKSLPSQSLNSTGGRQSTNEKTKHVVVGWQVPRRRRVLGCGLEGAGAVWEWVALVSGLITRCPLGRVTCERRPEGDECLLVQSWCDSFLTPDVLWGLSIFSSRKLERHPAFLLLKRTAGVHPALKPGITGLNHPSPLSSKTLLQSVIIYFRVESQ